TEASSVRAMCQSSQTMELSPVAGRARMSASDKLPRARSKYDGAPPTSEAWTLACWTRKKLTASMGSELLVRVDDRAPHVGDRRAVVAQALLGLAKMPPDDVEEGLDRVLGGLVEAVVVVERDHAGIHVPPVAAGVAIGSLDVRWRAIVLAEDPEVHLRIRVADRLVRIVPKGLVVSNRPHDLLRHVRLDELGAPP